MPFARQLSGTACLGFLLSSWGCSTSGQIQGIGGSTGRATTASSATTTSSGTSGASTGHPSTVTSGTAGATTGAQTSTSGNGPSASTSSSTSSSGSSSGSSTTTGGSTTGTANSSFNWTFTLGTTSVVPNPVNEPNYQYFPDGHISMLPTEDGGQYEMFWANFTDYRTVGSGPQPQTQTTLGPTTSIFGDVTAPAQCGWDNGGSWLYNVRRVGSELVAVYHAEDHWGCGVANPQGIAYKSMAVTSSTDDGLTWAPGQQVLLGYLPKPATPEWSGAGDGSTIWDPVDQRWLLFYQENIGNGASLFAAASSNPMCSVGTWNKWDGTGFTIDALATQSDGGVEPTPLSAFTAQEGANPSVHWNSLLQKWVMVYGSWDGSIYITSSVDLLDWDPPIFVVASQNPGGFAWYPTIIGDSDTSAGADAYLYYADLVADESSRQFMVGTLTFVRYD